MELEWKEDWAPARKRLMAWWEREATDRPCLQIFAPREPEDLPVLGAMLNWWPGPAQKMISPPARRYPLRIMHRNLRP